MSIIIIDDYRSKIESIYGKSCHCLYFEKFPFPVMSYYVDIPDVGRAEIFPRTLKEISNIIQMNYTSDYFHTNYKLMLVDHYVLPKRMEGLKWH